MGKYLKSPVSILSGIGTTRQKALERINIDTLQDLIYHIPRAYQNRGNVKLLKEALDGETSSFVLTVSSPPKNAITKNRLTVTKFRAKDESGEIDVIFFNQGYLKDVFTVGASFRFWGKIAYQGKRWQLSSPEFESIIQGKLLPNYIPVYSLSDGVTSKLLSKSIAQAMSLCLPELEDCLPEDVRKKNSLPSISYALRNIHNPESSQALRQAIKRLSYEELFCFSVGLQMIKRSQNTSCGIDCDKYDLFPLLSQLPYELTSAQSRVVDEIITDMTKEAPAAPMSRILIGDVGSGKTICAACAVYNAAKNGLQTSFMVPTEVLARQHYAEFLPLFEKFGIKVALLLGSTSAREKKKIYASLQSDGEDRIDVLIGTHSLLNEKVEFSNLGLVITDEQHRFGVNQRAILKKKNKGVHMLVMSATPIPRTFALAIYGDLDISYIDEMPVGRQHVDTFVVNEDYRQRLNAFIRRQIEEGGQVYIVCPMIEEENKESEISIEELSLSNQSTSDSTLKNVLDYEKNLREQIFPDLKTACLHGKLKPAEKDKIMNSFSSGETDILVSTTVIEVGVNVPNASLIIIENAERFGLAQLHQLRGRVGRGKRKSYCVLVSNSMGSVARSRLDVMRTTYDGYKIAEKDLSIRGPGDFFSSFCDGSIRQSGGVSLRFSSLCTDTELMQSAFRDARLLIEDDPQLSKPENRALFSEIHNLFNLNENIIN